MEQFRLWDPMLAQAQTQHTERNLSLQRGSKTRDSLGEVLGSQSLKNVLFWGEQQYPGGRSTLWALILWPCCCHTPSVIANTPSMLLLSLCLPCSSLHLSRSSLLTPAFFFRWVEMFSLLLFVTCAVESIWASQCEALCFQVKEPQDFKLQRDRN